LSRAWHGFAKESQNRGFGNGVVCRAQTSMVRSRGHLHGQTVGELRRAEAGMKFPDDYAGIFG
jgi:hypothetical protein